jgi:hypothetical protein
MMPIVKIAPLITMAPRLERKNRAHPLNAKMKTEKSDVCRWAHP